MLNGCVNEPLRSLSGGLFFRGQIGGTGEQAENYLRFELLAPGLPCLIWRFLNG